MASIMRGSGTIDHGKPDLELLPEKPQKSLTLEFRKAEVQRIDLRNKVGSRVAEDGSTAL